MTKEEIENRVYKEAEDFVRKHLADVKPFMPENQYDEMIAEFIEIFIAGANCVISIAKELKEQ